MWQCWNLIWFKIISEYSIWISSYWIWWHGEIKSYVSLDPLLRYHSFLHFLSSFLKDAFHESGWWLNTQAFPNSAQSNKKRSILHNYASACIACNKNKISLSARTTHCSVFYLREFLQSVELRLETHRRESVSWNLVWTLNSAFLETGFVWPKKKRIWWLLSERHTCLKHMLSSSLFVHFQLGLPILEKKVHPDQQS